MNAKVEKIYDFLIENFPEAKCELTHDNLYELLVAVILSAQCTDKRVNMITPDLFRKYPTIKHMAEAEILELEDMIKSCGFYHNKAKNILNACKEIVDKHNGKIPSDFETLIKLPGVGRKTANVVLSVGFGDQTIAVDTHVFRVSRRLGLADANSPEKVELQLQKVINKNIWAKMHSLMVLFGRYICKSQRPKCEECKLRDVCLYYKNKIQK
jgi:endonuclease-3